MGLSYSESDYSFQKFSGSGCMVNPVLVLVFCAGSNGVMHVHIMACIVVPCLLHNLAALICQYTVFPPSLW